jgi:TRAP-type mannitol/chloroaromatic compound transport system permease small subunit
MNAVSQALRPHEGSAEVDLGALDADPARPVERPTAFGWLVDGMNSIGSVLILLLMVLICTDVVARSLFKAPLHGVAEIAGLAVVAIVFLQLASTLRHGRMSRADIFIDGFVQRRPRTGHALRSLFHLLGFAVMALIVYATAPQLVRAWQDNDFVGVESVFAVPTWPVRLCVLLGCAATALQYLLLSWADARAALKGAAP